MWHEPIYEDLATLVESMAYWDRLITRNRASGWARHLSIQLPVYEYGQFRRADFSAALAEAAWFLTGDRWSFEFIVRKGPAPVRQGKLTLPQGMMRHVVSFAHAHSAKLPRHPETDQVWENSILTETRADEHDRVSAVFGD